MSAPVVPLITPTTIQSNDFSGTPNFGFGVTGTYGARTPFRYPLNWHLPRKILYYAVYVEGILEFDVRFFLSDLSGFMNLGTASGNELPPWQTTEGSVLPDSIPAGQLALKWGHNKIDTGELTVSTGNNLVLPSNSVVHGKYHANSANRRQIYSTGLRFTSSAKTLSVVPKWPDPNVMGDYMILLYVVEMPLGIKLHNKHYR